LTDDTGRLLGLIDADEVGYEALWQINVPMKVGIFDPKEVVGTE
jgi:hypothetical protein